jgi:MFS family permease
MLLGQPAGALLFTVFGPRLSFVLDMVSFLAIGLVVLALRSAGLGRDVAQDEHVTGHPQAFDLAQTVRFRQVVAGSGLWVLFIGVWIAAFGSSAEGTVFPFFVDQTMHVPTTWFGVFNAAWAAGGIVGGSLLARYQPGRGRVVMVAAAAMAGMALGIALPATWPTAIVTLVCFAVGGLCNGMLNAALATAVHQSISQNRYGLVWGTFGAVASAAAGAGHLLGVAGGGWPRQTVFLSGVWLLIAVLGMPVVSRIAARRTPPGDSAGLPNATSHPRIS